MNFHMYLPNWNKHVNRHSPTDEAKCIESWKHRMRHLLANADPDVRVDTVFGMTEMEWLKSIRPYYKVWPSVYDMLERIPLDVPINKLCLPDIVVSLRFGVGAEPVSGRVRITSILVGVLGGAVMATITNGSIVDTSGREQYLLQWPFAMPLNDEETPEERLFRRGMSGEDVAINMHPEVREFIPAAEMMSMRLAFGIMLLAKDASLFDRDVLAKDRRKFGESGDERYVDKARKRGINGWSIGKHFETCPHWRRPYLGWRWTGKGKKIPRLVPIKSCIVHRKKITDVPTGYTLPSGQDVEPVAD